MSLVSHIQLAAIGFGGQQPVFSSVYIPQFSPIKLSASSGLTNSGDFSDKEIQTRLLLNSLSLHNISKSGRHRKIRQVPDFYYQQHPTDQQQQQQQQQQPDYDNENIFFTNQVLTRGRFNQHKNKKPVYVSINQETVNGLLSLLLLFVVSICGCIGTILIISSLTVIESLQTRGNCYLVSLALAHLIVTLLVIPTSALQIMAGDGIDGRRLCHYQWLILEFSLMVSQLSFLLIAIDNYLGYKSSEKVVAASLALVDPLKKQQLHPISQFTSDASGNPNELHANNPPSSSLCKYANEAASRPRSSSYVSLINTGARVNVTAGSQQSQSSKDAQQQQQQQQQLTNPIVSQKLSLARQFAGEPGVKAKQGGCLSYRNCCGRLRVFIWILAVWIFAIGYTFHEHELRYGTNFCNDFPSARRTAQNLSISQQKQQLQLQQQQQQQQLIMNTGKQHQRDSLVTDSTDFEGGKRSKRAAKREVGDTTTGPTTKEKFTYLKRREEANSAGKSLEQPLTKVSRVIELEMLGGEGGRMELSEFQLDSAQSRGDHLQRFSELKRSGRGRSKREGSSGDGVLLLSGGELAMRPLSSESLEVPLDSASELPAARQLTSQRMRSVLELEGSVHHYLTGKDVSSSTSSFSNQREYLATELHKDDQLKERTVRDLADHEQEPDGWFPIDSSDARSGTSAVKAYDKSRKSIYTPRFPNGPNDERQVEEEEVETGTNVNQTSRDYERSALVTRTSISPSWSLDSDATAYLNSRKYNRQVVSERQANEKNELSSSSPSSKSESSSSTDSFGQARQQLMIRKPLFAANSETHYDSYHRNKISPFSHKLDIHTDNVSVSDTLERDESDSSVPSSVWLENDATSFRREENSRQSEVRLESALKFHHALNHHLTFERLLKSSSSVRPKNLLGSSSFVENLKSKQIVEGRKVFDEAKKNANHAKSYELENGELPHSESRFQQLSRTYLNGLSKGSRERRRLMNNNNNNNNNALGMQIALERRNHFASRSFAGKPVEVATAATRDAPIGWSLTNHSGAQSHSSASRRRTSRAADRRIIKLPPTTPSSSFPEPAKLMASPDLDSSLTLSKQESVNELTVTNSMSSSSFQKLPTSDQVKLESSGKSATKWHWIILTGSTVIPSLVSALLFTKAYFRMKEFKMHPYEPMPINAPTSTLFDFLAFLPRQQQHNQTAYQLKARATHQPQNKNIDSMETQQVNVKIGTSSRQQSSCKILTFEKASNQNSPNRAVDSSSAPELLTKVRNSSNPHPKLSPDQHPMRADLPSSSPENLTSSLQHRQVNQVMSAPINSQLILERSQVAHLRLLSQPHPHSSSSSVAPSMHQQQQQQQQQQHWPQRAMLSQLIESPQQRLDRNASHSAPPRQIDLSNISAVPDNLTANNSSGSSYYQFRRRQHHAQSFHCGSSSLAAGPSYTRPSQPITLSCPPVRQQEHLTSIDHQLFTQEDQVNPAQAQAQAVTISIQQQHLLERHRSLPRSSRLYQPTDTKLAEPEAASASVSESTQATRQTASAQLDYQQQQHLFLAPLGETEPADSEIKQITKHPASNGQLKQAHLQALANVIKSMDDSHSSGAKFHSAGRQKTENGELATNKTNTNSANLSSQQTSPRNRMASGGFTGANQERAAAKPAAAVAVAAFTTDSSLSNDDIMNSSNRNSRAILCTYTYMADDQLLKSNIIVFIVNLTLWFPFIILSLVSQYRNHLTQEFKDSVWWMATLNCCSCSYVYALTNKDFREAFNKLFYYCCCKSHVTFQRKTPIFKRQIDIDSSGDVRVRVFPGLNLYSNKLSALKGVDCLPPSNFPRQQYSSSLSPVFSADSSANSNHLDHHHQATVASHQHTQHHHQQQSQHRHHHMSVGGGFGGPLFGQPTGSHSTSHTLDRQGEL